MSELARRHERATGQAVRLNVAGSNVLARQIVEGAPADVFVSADDAQMDVVERAGRLVPGSRVTLLTNQLVVVGSPATALRVTGPRSLADPAVRRLALGNPESVPAGVYARQWLERAGIWPAVARKVVPTLTVRAALAAVRAGRVDAAVVYATDARTEPVGASALPVPPADAPPMRYPAAVVDGPKRDAAERFVAFLQRRRGRRPCSRPPVSASLGRSMNQSLLGIAAFSVATAAMAMLLALPMALGLGWLLARATFRGKAAASRRW